MNTIITTYRSQVSTRFLGTNYQKLLPVFWVLTAKSKYPFFTYMQLNLLHTIKPIHTIKLYEFTQALRDL